jgi:hypothetical protein
MHKLPQEWVAIDRGIGSASRGLVHHGLVSGVPIYAQDFNGIHCIGAEGSRTFVVGERLDGEPKNLVLFVVHQSNPRNAEAVHMADDVVGMFEWILQNGGGPLPRDMIVECATGDWVREAFRRIDELQNRPVEPHYAVHTYAVIRIKTIGDAPREGESIKDFGQRVSDAVAASLNRINVRGVAPEGCDVEQIEYAEDIAYVLVDEIVPDNSDPSGQQTIMHWFDDRMEPNNGNGTDPARYVRAEKEKERLLRIATNRSDRLLALHGLVYDIARTPLQGEPCADSPGGRQAWLDREHVLERLTEIVRQCREALKRDDAIHHKLTETT